MTEEDMIHRRTLPPPPAYKPTGGGSINTVETINGRKLAQIPKYEPTARKTAVQPLVVPESKPQEECPVRVPFPTECLPSLMAKMVREVARVHKVPESLPGCCALGVVSGAIGAGLQIKSRADRSTRGNIFVMGSANSGTGKSEVMRVIDAPLLQQAAKLEEYHRLSVYPKAAAEKRVLEQEIKKLERHIGKSDCDRSYVGNQLAEKEAALNANEILLSHPSLLVDNVTNEKLGIVLSQNNETIMSISADAGDVINNLFGRYSKIKRLEDTVFLKGFSGDPCKIDRVSRPPVNLSQPCLTVLWLVQPDKLDVMLKEKALVDGGLLPRFLICHTDAVPSTITKEDEAMPEGVIADWTSLVTGLLETYRLPKDVKFIQIEPDCKQIIDDYCNSVTAQHETEYADVWSFAARWGEQAWRLSVVLHAGLYGKSAHEVPISLETVNSAVKIAQFFAKEQLAVLQANRGSSKKELFSRVKELAREKGEISATDLTRKRISKSAKHAHGILEEMERLGLLISESQTPANGGHTTTVYRLTSTK